MIKSVKCINYRMTTNIQTYKYINKFRVDKKDYRGATAFRNSVIIRRGYRIFSGGGQSVFGKFVPPPPAPPRPPMK